MSIVIIEGIPAVANHFADLGSVNENVVIMEEMGGCEGLFS